MLLLRRRREGLGSLTGARVDGAEHAERGVPPVDESGARAYAGWSIADVSVTVAKVLTSREWFRDPGGHCIDCRDRFPRGAAP
jgi:hypothetical protein